jgi:sirohydrochlorin ferrochelatase
LHERESEKGKATSVELHQSSGTDSKTDVGPVDPNHFFDPTLSPHQYSRGTPDRIVGEEMADPLTSTKKVGILLMDHGSRNPAANQRLFDLAELYQESLATDSYTVTAAHMELAPPTIEDGIALLVDSGVDEIVCHPYFLSPGRHVQEDIPELVAEAVKSLSVQRPVITTAPVGSNSDLMIQAIDGLVQQASRELNRQC